MEHLGEIIIQKGFVPKVEIERISSRGIILNEKNEILLIHSTFYDDVTMPGGGVDPGESLTDALHRECLEEVGAVIDDFKPFFKITEKRFQKNMDANVFTSYYYICTCKEFVETSLLDYEIKLGYSSVWMSFDDAINLNTKTLNKLIGENKNTSVVEREIRILNKLKEIYGV
ncbi:MAG: NUDIX domain-containing protein [bacterium]